jgi:hypothetical protein
MEKTIKKKNFNNFVWTPLGSTVNIYINFCLKGIDRPFGGGVKSRLIRSLLINWRLGNFLKLILNGFHHKISKKPKDAA